MKILILMPALLLIIIVFGYPIIRYAWLSFHTSSVITKFELINNNGANWIRIIHDDRFWNDSFQTLRFAFTSVFMEIILAVAIAILLNQSFRGRPIVRAISLLPWALPTTIMALGWRWIFNTPYGPIDQVASLL